MSVQVDRLDTFESSKPWDFFGKDAMKLGIEAVSLDCDRHETAYRLFERASMLPYSGNIGRASQY